MYQFYLHAIPYMVLLSALTFLIPPLLIFFFLQFHLVIISILNLALQSEIIRLFNQPKVPCNLLFLDHLLWFFLLSNCLFLIYLLYAFQLKHFYWIQDLLHQHHNLIKLNYLIPPIYLMMLLFSYFSLIDNKW